MTKGDKSGNSGEKLEKWGKVGKAKSGEKW